MIIQDIAAYFQNTENLPHIIYFVVAVIAISVCIAAMSQATKTPDLNSAQALRVTAYENGKASRKSLDDYFAANPSIKSDALLLKDCQVLTANFGGIQSESPGTLVGWTGSVSKDALTYQIEAGARAVIFDLWPDPANPNQPIVASMVDTQEGGVLATWKNRLGLNRGVGSYSNWQRRTRNVGYLSDLLPDLLTKAFDSNTAGPHAHDPFFLILNLHGAMTTDYLNALGSLLLNAAQGRAPKLNALRGNNQSACATTLQSLKDTVSVLVYPDIQTGFNPLPNTATLNDFITQFNQTTMGEVTTYIATQPYQLVLPSNVAALKTANYPNCNPGTANTTLPNMSLCVVQPSTGLTTNDNDGLFHDTNYADAIASGAQFVGLNFLSPASSDKTLDEGSKPLFGTYSFYAKRT